MKKTFMNLSTDINPFKSSVTFLYPLENIRQNVRLCLILSQNFSLPNCITRYSLKVKRSQITMFPHFRSSHPEVFCKKVVLKNLGKFTGKHLYRNLVFHKAAGQTYKVIKKRTPTQALSCEFCQIFNNIFFIQHLRWLLFALAC